MIFTDIVKSIFNKGASKTTVDTLAGSFGGGGIKRTKARAGVRYLKNQHKQQNASLASVSSLSVLDPVGIYDGSLKRYEGMDLIMQMALIVIMGYVLRAIPFLAERTRSKVITVLSQLSPSSSPTQHLEQLQQLPEEIFEFGLPNLTTEAASHYKGSKGSRSGSKKAPSNRSDRNSKRRAQLTGRSSGLQDGNDYSTGKSFEIEIPIDRNETQTVPLTMILQARYADYETIKGIADGGSPSRGWLERWIKFQAGSNSVGELVSQGDLVAKDVKAAMADKSGVHAEIMRRKANGLVGTTFGGKVKYGIGSNLLITSLGTTERLMKDLRFDISDYKQRQNIMGAFSCLVWIVVDKEEDYIINYYRDIRLAGETSLASVERLIKKGGASDTIVESLRALSANRAPVI